MMQQQRMANDGRAKNILYLDLMGISHRSYFADKPLTFCKELRRLE